LIHKRWEVIIIARPKGSLNKPKDNKLDNITPECTELINITPDIQIVNKGGRPTKYEELEDLKFEIDKYFSECEVNKKAPIWHDMLVKLSISDRTLLRYRSNEDDKYNGFDDVIKKAEQRFSSFWQQYALDHPNLQSFCMFQLKQPHNGGFIDRPKDDKSDLNINVNLGLDRSNTE
jgi:hypothetical protein